MSLASIVLMPMLVLAACGGTLELGDFASTTKTEGDAAFTLVAPSSKSPASVTCSNSDASVATIEGNV